MMVDPLKGSVVRRVQKAREKERMPVLLRTQAQKREATEEMKVPEVTPRTGATGAVRPPMRAQIRKQTE